MYEEQAVRDTIYREDAIKAMEELRKEPYWLHDGDDYRVCGLSEAEDAIERLPSADRPQGEWETAGKQFKYIRCPYCKTTRASSRSRFCGWCGARLKGADDE